MPTQDLFAGISSFNRWAKLARSWGIWPVPLQSKPMHYILLLCIALRRPFDKLWVSGFSFWIRLLLSVMRGTLMHGLYGVKSSLFRYSLSRSWTKERDWFETELIKNVSPTCRNLTYRLAVFTELGFYLSDCLHYQYSLCGSSASSQVSACALPLTLSYWGIWNE